jgi:hypothetical protein
MGRRWVVAGLLLASACKAELSDNAALDANNSQRDGSADAPIDTPAVLGAWGMAMPVPGASDATLAEDDCSLSSNKLELYFKRTDGGTNNNLYMMTRASLTDAWGSPMGIGVLNSTTQEESPRLSPDDLTLYFGRDGDIYKSTRTAVGQPWSAASPVTPLNTLDYEKWAHVCSNGYVIVSRQTPTNAQDLFEGTLTAGAPTPLTTFNTATNEQGTLLSPDCLHVYFQSNRDNDQFDMFEATRTSPTGAWSDPTKLPDFNTTTSSEEDPWVSTDQRVFVYASNASGIKDLYISTR